MFRWHLSSLTFIALVDEAVNSILRRVLPGLFGPKVHNIFKRFRTSDIIDQNDCIRSFVVRFGDSSESFLSSCIPYLQFYITFFDVERSKLDDHYLNLKSMPMVDM